MSAARTEGRPGGCFCGAVRYRLADRPMFVHACHCRDCQIQTGGPFALNGIIEAECVEMTGATETIAMHTDSGAPHDIIRCAACRTALASDYGRKGWRLFVRLATLDDPTEFPPDVHIYTRSAWPFFTLPADVPAFTSYYEPEKLWPEASLKRRAEAMARASL